MRSHLSADKRNAIENNIIVVSGLPRSGTSMMMQMLEAGGLEILTDHQREADINNPNGYYEFERVKKLPEGDFEWLNEAHGKVVKIISTLLVHLPQTHTYTVIFMRRNIQEILRSQKAMLEKRGKTTSGATDEDLAALYEYHLEKTFKWLNTQPNIAVGFVNYNDLLKDATRSLLKINTLTGGPLEVSKMSEIIDNRLYRQRN